MNTFLKVIRWILYAFLIVIALIQVVAAIASTSATEMAVRGLVVFAILLFFAVKIQRKLRPRSNY